MSYYLFNWFLHFGYGVVICGLGVFFIFLSNGKFEDVASWLYSSRNFLLLTIKALAFITTYKVMSFYKRGVSQFEDSQGKDNFYNLLVFFLTALILRYTMISSPSLTVNSVSHLVSLGLDFSLFLLLRRYFKEFSWTDLLLISFTQTVIYFMIYQESFYLSFIGLGFFYFLYQYLNRWNNIPMVIACSLSGVFIFVESIQSKQEMFLYYISLFSSYFVYLILRNKFTKLKVDPQV